MVNIALVDDHPVARRGMEHMLAPLPEVSVVLSTGSVDELRDALVAAEHAVDVVVLDLYLDSDRPSLDAVREFAARTTVLVMSASGRPADVLGAMRAGAAGYLTKQSSPEVVVAAVTTVAAGGFALSPRLADILHAELTRTGPLEPDEQGELDRPRLSAREEETLGYISRGLTHAQAAIRMGVSKATVDTYVERIRAKLHLGNKAQLTAAALRRQQAGGLS